MTPELVIEARRHAIGDLEVGRVLPFAKRRMVGPFIFFDHIGPLDIAPGLPRSADVRPHPHIGLATVTYLFSGEITHRDSLGFEQVIRPGEVNWMTAGRGISHSERFEGMRRTGGMLHGIQAWVALPEASEETEPGFEHYGAEALPRIAEKGVTGRVVAGTAFGGSSAVTTSSPLFYVHLELQPGSRIAMPTEQPERAAYVAAGGIDLAGRSYGAGQMLVFAAGAAPIFTATQPTILLLIGGEPLGERHIWWNFVSSGRERIEQAKADWRAGRIPLPASDNAEFIPLPEDPTPRPEPAS